MAKKTIEQISLESQLIAQRLEQLEVGDVIEYEELTTLIGRDIRKHRGHLATARNRLLRDKQMVFGTIHTVGLKRLSDAEKITVGRSYIKRSHQAAHKSLVTFSAINLDNLSGDEARRLHSVSTQARTLQYLSTQSSEQKIEKSLDENRPKELPVGKVMDLFKN